MINLCCSCCIDESQQQPPHLKIDPAIAGANTSTRTNELSQQLLGENVHDMDRDQTFPTAVAVTETFPKKTDLDPAHAPNVAKVEPTQPISINRLTPPSTPVRSDDPPSPNGSATSTGSSFSAFSSPDGVPNPYAALVNYHARAQGGLNQSREVKTREV